MSTKPPIAARIPSASPRTLLTGSARARRACARPRRRRADLRDGRGAAERRRERAASCAFSRTARSMRGNVLRVAERVREVRRLDRELLGLLAREERVVRPRRDVVREQRALAGDRVERRSVVRQRMPIDGAAVTPASTSAATPTIAYADPRRVREVADISFGRSLREVAQGNPVAAPSDRSRRERLRARAT